MVKMLKYWLVAIRCQTHQHSKNTQSELLMKHLIRYGCNLGFSTIDFSLNRISDYSTRTTVEIGEVHFRAEGDVTVYLIECSGSNEVKLVNRKESSKFIENSSNN